MAKKKKVRKKGIPFKTKTEKCNKGQRGVKKI